MLPSAFRLSELSSLRKRFVFFAILCLVQWPAATWAGALPATPATTNTSPAVQVLHKHVPAAVTSNRAVEVGVLPASQQMHLAILLKARDQAKLTSLLARLQDKSSPDYRHFLSVEQFTEQFAPTAADYATVVNFAKAHGLTVTNTPKNRLIVDVAGSVSNVQAALHVQMKVYKHPTENRTFYSTDREPSLELSVPVAFIEGLDNFSIPRPRVTRAANGQSSNKHAGSGPGGNYLGSDMRAAYYGGTALTGTGQSVGLFELDGYDPTDVTNSFAGQTNNVPIKNVLVDGASAGSDGYDGEQVLDIVQAAAMAPGLDHVLVYIGPGSEWAAGVVEADVFNQMATDNIAKQLSCSWGWNPNDKTALDTIFQEFAVQGQNLFDGIGDTGALTGNNAFDDYLWPGDDAYLTAVGGTDLVTNGAGGPWQSETAWVCGSGGPSDNGISIPSWQVGVGDPDADASTTLRNVPDISAESNQDNYVCAQNGGPASCNGGWGGTSFAAPRLAGYLALVNQQAVAAGYTSVGFINPALYQIGQSSNYDTDFHDITSGNNNCRPTEVSTYWNAVTGYDLATGWGSPNGQPMIDALVGTSVSITSANSTAFTPGNSGSFTVTTTGYPIPALSEVGTLPGTVQLHDNGDGTATLSGTAPTGSNAMYPITITASNGTAPSVSQNFTLMVSQSTPVLTWNPAPLEIDSKLGAAQLNATANVPGTFVYTPKSGTKVTTATETLKVVFTPTNTAAYSTVSKTVALGVDVVEASPSSINFGTVYLGSVTKKNVTITNKGPNSIGILNPLIAILTTGDSREFLASNLCPSELPSHKSCTIQIAYVAGAFFHQQSATLKVMDNSPGNPQKVALTALTIDPEVKLSATSLSFGTQKVNTSVMKSVTLTNPGLTALTLNSVAVTGADPHDFTLTNPCSSSLGAGSSCTINVTFKPEAKGARSAELVFKDNAKNTPQEVKLSGSGD